VRESLTNETNISREREPKFSREDNKSGAGCGTWKPRPGEKGETLAHKQKRSQGNR